MITYILKRRENPMDRNKRMAQNWKEWKDEEQEVAKE